MDQIPKSEPGRSSDHESPNRCSTGPSFVEASQSRRKEQHGCDANVHTDDRWIPSSSVIRPPDSLLQGRDILTGTFIMTESKTESWRQGCRALFAGFVAASSSRQVSSSAGPPISRQLVLMKVPGQTEHRQFLGDGAERYHLADITFPSDCSL